jgi:hypothetical protein
MGEIISIHQDLIPHWESHLRSAEILQERAVQNLGRLYIAVSGQMELPFEEEVIHEDIVA